MSLAPSGGRPAPRLDAHDDSRRPVSNDATVDRTGRFRPLMRPPMALLRIYDDGEDTFETVRIRKSSFTIGRVEGDVTIPHDNMISGKHARLHYKLENDDYVWYLQDIGSTNGTFVRAATIVLRPKQVLLLGGRRFDSTGSGEGEPSMPSATSTIDGAKQWQQMASDGLAELMPHLIDVTGGRAGQKISLTNQEHWIGSDPTQCSIYIDDPMVSPCHARLYKDAKGRWCVEDANSLNGIWMQVQEAAIGKGCHFQCGEQRFSVKVL